MTIPPQSQVDGESSAHKSLSTDESDQAAGCDERSGSPPSSVDEQRRVWWKDPRVALAIGVLLRCLFVTTPDRLTGDEIDHYNGSVQVAHGETPTVVPFRPPAYVYFGGMILRFLGDAPDYIRIVQVLLDGVAILFIFRFGEWLYGRSCGSVAAWLYALSPEHISYSHTLWTEAVLPLMMILGWASLMRLHQRPGIVISLATGFVWGLLALLKPFNLYFFPILTALSLVCAWIDKQQQRNAWRFIWTGSAVLSQVCVVSPWCDFTKRPAVVISTQGARVLNAGTNYFAPPEFDFSYLRDVPAEQRRRQGRRGGIALFVLRNPVLFISRALEKMTNLWAPNSFLLRHIYSGHYGNPYGIPSWVRVGLSAFTVFSIGLVLILAVFGIMGAKLEFYVLSVLCYVGCTIGMISLTVSLSRYRVPLMPLLMIHAAYFLTSTACRVTIRVSDIRKLILVSSVTILMLFWAYRLPSMVQALW